MSGIVTAAVLVLVTGVIVLILVLTAPRRKSPPTAAERGTQGDRNNGASSMGSGRRWPCPLCGELLGPGERIRSIVRLSMKHGRIMEISGCPRCLPPLSRRRTCPVCRAELGPDEVLTARVFDRSQETAKPHVHVLGCSRCTGR